MALTLTSTITAAATVIQVTGTVPADVVRGYLFAIDDEVLEFGHYERDTGPLTSNPTADDTDRWSVRRGVGGSAAATHLADASLYGVRDAFVKSADLTPPDPFPLASADADAITVSPSVAGASTVQAMGEALEARVAAFVEPTTATPEAIANALIDAGLMEAS